MQEFRKKLGLHKKDKIELIISTDNGLKNMLEKQEEFIKERTNSKKFKIISEDVTTDKERFKNKTDFQIKDKKGEILVVK